MYVINNSFVLRQTSVKEKYIINKTTKTHMKIQSWHGNPTMNNRDRREEEKTYS